MVDRKPLRLKAQDEEDLSVLSSLLQDSLLAVGEFMFLPKQHRFVVTASRFQWEKEQFGPDGKVRRGKRSHARVRTGVHFDGVLSVKSRNIKQDQPDGLLELLALSYEAGEDGAGTLRLVFSGGADLQLETECIDVTLTDISPAWKTRKRPGHDLED